MKFPIGWKFRNWKVRRDITLQRSFPVFRPPRKIPSWVSGFRIIISYCPEKMHYLFIAKVKASRISLNTQISFRDLLRERRLKKRARANDPHELSLTRGSPQTKLYQSTKMKAKSMDYLLKTTIYWLLITLEVREKPWGTHTWRSRSYW